MERIVKAVLMSLCFSMVSCSSVTKFGTEKHLYVKKFDMSSQANMDAVKYYATRENDEHCFKSNPNNKEIITVKSDHIQYAIDHFYGRVVSVSVKIMNDRGYRYIQSTVKDDANFKLETANCMFEQAGSLFSNQFVMYTSFRLADK